MTKPLRSVAHRARRPPVVDEKKDKEVNEEEIQTPDEASEQLPDTDGTVDATGEDISGEDVSGEDITPEDVSGETVPLSESEEAASAEEEVAEEEVAEEEVAEEEAAPVAAAVAADDADNVSYDSAGHGISEHRVQGVAALFDHPKHLLAAAALTRDSVYEDFDAFSPFPVHGMDDAMGLGRSWIPWVTTAAALVGFFSAVAIQFGMMTFDWPQIIGGKSFAPWPSFVPVMFELSVLIGGVTTVIVMFKAAGCFKKPVIIDPRITDDRFALWISADDKNFELDEALEFLEKMNPLEVRKVVKDA